LLKITREKYSRNAFKNVSFIAGILRAKKGTKNAEYPLPDHRSIAGTGE